MKSVRFVLNSFKVWMKKPESGPERLVDGIIILNGSLEALKLNRPERKRLGEVLKFLRLHDSRAISKIDSLALRWGLTDCMIGDSVVRRATTHPVIDLNTGRLSAKNRVIFSKAIACLLWQLKQKESVELSVIAFTCFGIRTYDSVIHSPRIFNLLTRARKLFSPDLKFMVREDVIHAVGSWKRVSFIQESIWASQLKASEKWSIFILSSQEETPRMLGKFPDDPQEIFKNVMVFTRSDLEKFGVSKSTANRWIRYWIKTGRVERVRGKTKYIQYRVNAR